MRAVLNETMRLFPPVPMNLRLSDGQPRAFPASPNTPKYYVPPRTVILYSVFLIQRRRDLWGADALAFRPERWLAASGVLSLRDALARLPRTSVRGPPPSMDALSASCAGGDGGPTGKEDAAFVLAHDETAFLPFSHGPMNCPGRGLALLELRAVACALLRRFRVRLAPAWDPARYDREYKDYFSATRPDLPVLLEGRE